MKRKSGRNSVLSVSLALILSMLLPISAFADNSGVVEYNPPGYGTDFSTDGEIVNFNTPVNEMSPVEEQEAGITQPFAGIQTRATYNTYAFVTGSSDWTVYSTATGSTSIGYVGPRERVYVYNNNSNSSRYYIQFMNYGTLDYGYVATSALRVPNTGWSRPIVSGSISCDYNEPIGTGYHKGIDVAASSGTSVYAVANVSHSSKSMLATINNTTYLVNFGNYISCIASNSEVIYAHLSSFTNGAASSYPSYDNEVSDYSIEPVDTWTPSKGAQIGGVGSTGNSSGNHLHFEVRSSSDYRDKSDPYQYVVFPGVGY
jgi:murein DD-endopeptidase MepM/ murein hydrolase activator NlpD